MQMKTFIKINIFLEGKRPSAPVFLFYARQASQIMDQYTFGRLTIMEDVPEEAKLCCCELAEVYLSAGKDGKKCIRKDF